MPILRSGSVELQIRSGGLKKLFIDKELWMTNKPHEYLDHKPIADMYGHLVLGGLGIGLAIELAKENPKISKITVIEINEDVIKLVDASGANVINDDVWAWTPNEHIDCVWLDVWIKRTGGKREELIERYKQWADIVRCWPDTARGGT